MAPGVDVPLQRRTQSWGKPVHYLVLVLAIHLETVRLVNPIPHCKLLV